MVRLAALAVKVQVVVQVARAAEAEAALLSEGFNGCHPGRFCYNSIHCFVDLILSISKDRHQVIFLV